MRSAGFAPRSACASRPTGSEQGTKQMIAAATSRSYWSRIWELRHFLLCLVQLDLRNRYRRTLLGIGWSLLNPIFMVIVLCVVFHQAFHKPLGDYAPFV